MVQKAKVLASTPDDLSSIPGTSMVVRENQLRLAVLWSHMGINVCMHACAHMQTKQSTNQQNKGANGKKKEMFKRLTKFLNVGC